MASRTPRKITSPRWLLKATSQRETTITITKPSHIRHVFDLQSAILRVFGLWSRPAQLTNFDISSLHRLLFLVLVIPATPISLYLVLRSIAALKEEDKSNPEARPVVHALAMVPNIAVALRGILILLFLAITKLDLCSICEELNNVVWMTLSKSEVIRKVKKWTWWNIGIVLYCVGAFVPVCALTAVHTAQLSNQTFADDLVLKPFHGTVKMWVYFLLEALFSWLPYLLSHLILLTATTCSIILFDCCKTVNANLHRLEGNVAVLCTDSKIAKFQQEEHYSGVCVELDALAGELEDLMKTRAAIFHFIERLNHSLGFVFCLSYIVDIVASGGMLAVLVTNEERTEVAFPTKLVGTIVFVTYATLPYVPMVMATEAAEETNYILYQITIKAYSIIKHQLGTTLNLILGDFRMLMTMFPIHFTAARIFHIDRNFLVATFSLLFTFAILLEELLGQMSVKALVASSTNTSALLQAVLNSTNASTTDLPENLTEG